MLVESVSNRLDYFEENLNKLINQSHENSVLSFGNDPFFEANEGETRVASTNK